MCVCVWICVCECVRVCAGTLTPERILRARLSAQTGKHERPVSLKSRLRTLRWSCASLRYNHTPHGAFAAAAVDGTPKAHTVRRALKKVREGQASRSGTMGPSPRC
ncbi:hypothetical protein AMECASPLE_002474 [Ameca splendens]|uniref:Secreted protein n=1 Tax=Ameca splendens TaxID=208324 RepID=A0ABV0XMA5_9TELE